MAYSQIDTNGAIEIPAELREQMNLKPGTRVVIEREGLALILRPITPEFIDSFMGMTKDAGEERESSHRDDKEL